VRLYSWIPLHACSIEQGEGSTNTQVLMMVFRRRCLPWFRARNASAPGSWRRRERSQALQFGQITGAVWRRSPHRQARREGGWPSDPRLAWTPLGDVGEALGREPANSRKQLAAATSWLCSFAVAATPVDVVLPTTGSWPAHLAADRLRNQRHPLPAGPPVGRFAMRTPWQKALLIFEMICSCGQQALETDPLAQVSKRLGTGCDWWS